MSRWTSGGLAIVALAGVAACDRAQPTASTEPAVAAAAVTSTCSFRTLQRLATRYFGGQEASDVRSLLRAMEAAGPTTAIGRSLGFDVMVHVASNVKAGNRDPADASSLTNNLLACMYADEADLPLTFPEDFGVATDPAQPGGYEVRGGPMDLQGPVLSRPLSASFSGVAPVGTNTWAEVLDGNPAPARVLFYGKPGPEPQTYDWKVVPRQTAFSPPVMVGLCIDADVAATSMVREEGVGLLPFVEVPFLDLNSCSAGAAEGTSVRLLNRLTHWGAGVLWPRSLSARVVVFAGLGGSTGGIGSVFGQEQVDSVTLSFVVQPTDATVNQVITPAVVVRATVAGTATPVPSVAVTLAAQENFGNGADLQGTLTQSTDATGSATFADLSETKVGGYVLMATGVVSGRQAILVSMVRSVRFNVRP